MIRVFIDFDGTITRKDVGDAMFERFGGKRCTELIQQYREEKISAIECFQLECKACGEVDLIEFNAFLDRQEIDGSFADFVKFCRSRGMECVIVSDGLDYYIKRILMNNGLSDIEFFSNSLQFITKPGTKKVRLQPSFPFTDEMCDRCACCKRNHILATSADDDIIVYIGEGYSDRCPSRYADIVFAKDELLVYCQKEKIPCYEYESFDDIRRLLEKFLAGAGKRGLKKRRRAELARKEVFMGE